MPTPENPPEAPTGKRSTALAGYMILVVSIVIALFAVVLGAFLIGKKGTAGPTGAAGPRGADIPANYIATNLTADTPNAGSSYNGKYFFVQGPTTVALTALNCAAGDTFMIANPLLVPVTVSPKSFSFPSADFDLAPNSFARCGVSGLQDGSLSLLCLPEAYTPA